MVKPSGVRKMPNHVNSESVWIRCSKCGYLWFPNPRKWRSFGDKEGKVLQCPECNYRNKLSAKLVDKIKKSSSLHPEWGIGLETAVQ